jgi:hypothetical protein
VQDFRYSAAIAGKLVRSQLYSWLNDWMKCTRPLGRHEDLLHV